MPAHQLSVLDPPTPHGSNPREQKENGGGDGPGVSPRSDEGSLQMFFGIIWAGNGKGEKEKEACHVVQRLRELR